MKDFVICELLSTNEAECIDRQPTGGRFLPPADDEDSVLEVIDVEVVGEWTTVTFLKPTVPLDDQDYDLAQVGSSVETDKSKKEGPDPVPLETKSDAESVPGTETSRAPIATFHGLCGEVWGPGSTVDTLFVYVASPSRRWE